jgi:hypothetical protein
VGQSLVLRFPPLQVKATEEDTIDSAAGKESHLADWPLTTTTTSTATAVWSCVTGVVAVVSDAGFVRVFISRHETLCERVCRFVYEHIVRSLDAETVLSPDMTSVSASCDGEERRKALPQQKGGSASHQPLMTDFRVISWKGTGLLFHDVPVHVGWTKKGLMVKTKGLKRVNRGGEEDHEGDEECGRAPGEEEKQEDVEEANSSGITRIQLMETAAKAVCSSCTVHLSRRFGHSYQIRAPHSPSWGPDNAKNNNKNDTLMPSNAINTSEQPRATAVGRQSAPRDSRRDLTADINNSHFDDISDDGGDEALWEGELGGVPAGVVLGRGAGASRGGSLTTTWRRVMHLEVHLGSSLAASRWTVVVHHARSGAAANEFVHRLEAELRRIITAHSRT